MENIVRNLIRLFLVSLYPLLILFCFTFLYRKNRYKEAIQQNWKKILRNTIIFSFVLLVAIVLFFHFEDTIYSYDYAGHWLRSLQLRKAFFENPSEILSMVYQSMNHNDYSYLPALFNLGFIIINTSYGFFAISNFLLFLLPTFILLQVLYFSFTDKYSFLPVISCLAFYPLYLTIFYGEVDCVGLFFLLCMAMTILVPKFEEITVFDNLTVNLFAFCAIFLRRWYLYPVATLYLCYFVKYLKYYHFKPFHKKAILDFLKIISSGLLLLGIILMFFFPFFVRVISNNYAEAYAFYNRDGKLYNLINFYSPIILIVAAIGIYSFIKKEELRSFLLSLFLLIVIPTALFWSIQSFEYHHYYMISLNILIFFIAGLFFLFEQRKHILSGILILLFSLQAILVFTLDLKTMPLFTNIRKHPQTLSYKEEVVDFTYYLKSILTEDWQSAYLASGSSRLNDDMLRNSILPDIQAPQIDSAVLDLRDGFPKDLQFIQYVITINPIQYSDQNFQHIYDIISNAIWKEPLVSKIYQPVYTTTIDGLNVTIFEKTGEFTPEIKQYFYDEMIKIYPDKHEFFRYILE